MSEFFKYKTSADLISGASALGHTLEVAEDVASLFQPFDFGQQFDFGTCRAGNRLVIHPMEGCDGTLDGLPDELTYRRYRRFGGGGAKLIWGEAAAVCPEGRANTRQLWIADHSAAALEEMLRQCRQAHRDAGLDDTDLVVGLQLTHSGRYSVAGPVVATRDPLLDPLVIDKRTGRSVSENPLVTDGELERLADQFVAAAKLAYRIGFDFVDIKQCHRYLLSELLASTGRPGMYGGSFENRTRLALSIVRRVREECPGKLIATRMNAYDGIPHRARAEDNVGQPVPHTLPVTTAWGTDPLDPSREDLSEPVRYAQALCEAGVGLINVSMGNPYANPHVVRPADYPPVDGYRAPEHPLHGVARHFRIARAIQAAVAVPVVGGGYSWLQEFAGHVAAANVARGDTAFVGFGRATLSHPDFANALATEGRFHRKRVCRTFSYCTGLMRAKDHPLGQYETGCPPFDKEAYGGVWKEVEAKRAARGERPA
jgi:2,4-dienoyl-CoA reductase-like NADH-dependent reductase (Old Yellow Enzyme family)